MSDLYILKEGQVLCGKCCRPVRETNTYEIIVKDIAAIATLTADAYIRRKIKVCVRCKHESEHPDSRYRWEMDNPANIDRIDP